jgi:hypothetical protein
MKIRIWENFKSYADNDEPVEITDIISIHESTCGGLLLETEYSNIGFPVTIVFDIIKDKQQ